MTEEAKKDDRLSGAEARTKRLEEIQNEVGNLLDVMSEDLDKEALKHMKLFSRIQYLYNKEFLELQRLLVRLDSVKHETKKYYLGKSSEAVYKEKPLNVSVLKSDVDEYVKVDQGMVILTYEMKIQDQIVKYLEDSKSALKDRGFMIRHAIDFRRMINGQ